MARQLFCRWCLLRIFRALPPLSAFSFAVSPPCFHTVAVSHALLSCPSLPSPQIGSDSLSPPGLNHQGLLEGPNQGPVSPHRGFCLLAVETNDLHHIMKQALP